MTQVQEFCFLESQKPSLLLLVLSGALVFYVERYALNEVLS